MSELTLCNYCQLQQIKRQYRGKKIKVEADPKFVPRFPDGKKVTVGGEFVAWFAKLTKKCVC